MLNSVLAITAVVLGNPGAPAPPQHPCGAAAITRAREIMDLVAPGGRDVQVDPTFTVLPPLKALKGKGKLDVIEVWAHVYKADYRVRVLYAQIKDLCPEMGHEVLEASDPY